MLLAQNSGFKVRFLNQLEKEAVKRVRPATSLPDFETLRHVFEKVAEMAKFYIKMSKKYKAIIIALIDGSKFEEVLKLFEAVGLRYSVYQKRKMIMIYEQRLVEAILKATPHLFPQRSFLSNRFASVYITPALAPPLYISFVKAAPSKAENPLSYTAATQRFTKLSSPLKPIQV